MSFIPLKLSLEFLSLREEVGSVAVPIVIQEVPDVLLSSVEVEVFSVAVLLVVVPLSVVDVSVDVDVPSLADFEASLELSLVGLSVGEQVGAHALEQIVVPLSVVDVPVFVERDAEAFGYTCVGCVGKGRVRG